MTRGAGMTARQSIFYLASLLSALLAMKTKENAFTLPVMVALYEFMFFRGPVRKRTLGLLPFFLTMLIVPFSLGVNAQEAVGSVTGGPSGRVYLFTELRVIVTYMRLLLLPINQNIYYDYPVYHSFLRPEVAVSAVFILAQIALALYLVLKSGKAPALRLVGFGILWFFIALSVESGIVPLPMVINEYRVYLPSAGVFIAVSAGAGLLPWRKTAVVVLCLITLIFSGAAYKRNSLWGSRVSLWEDTVRKSPGKTPARNNLGLAYQAEGKTDKAIEQFQAVLKIEPDPPAHNNLGNIYSAGGRIDDAIGHYTEALRLKPDYAEARMNLGLAYKAKGLTDKAIEQLGAALREMPDAQAHNELGIAYAEKGAGDRAEEHFRAALGLRPDFAKARYNLGLLYLKRGDVLRARQELKEALEIEPDYPNAKNLLAETYKFSRDIP